MLVCLLCRRPIQKNSESRSVQANHRFCKERSCQAIVKARYNTTRGGEVQLMVELIVPVLLLTIMFDSCRLMCLRVHLALVSCSCSCHCRTGFVEQEVNSSCCEWSWRS